jgi:hypothetical protein
MIFAHVTVNCKPVYEFEIASYLEENKLLLVVVSTVVTYLKRSLKVDCKLAFNYTLLLVL